MEITVNGEVRIVPQGLTVGGLLESLGVDAERVAVELDREIVKRPNWGGTELQPGAQVEIVQFVGGG